MVLSLLLFIQCRYITTPILLFGFFTFLLFYIIFKLLRGIREKKTGCLSLKIR